MDPGTAGSTLLNVAWVSSANLPDLVPSNNVDSVSVTVESADLFVMPSLFEPCGLTQMQAMVCGTIPVVTDVGGLRDTVTDTDRFPRSGNGFVARRPDPMSLLDAVHRAARGWSNRRRRHAVQRRGMSADWSWAGPAECYLDLYEDAASVLAHARHR